MREPLDVAAVRAETERPDAWRSVVVVEETGSTNADLAAAAAVRDVAGEVLVAEHQTGGRGRLGRSWVAPRRSSLTFSVAVRPTRPPATLGWLPLLTGTAVADAVAAATGVEVRLKWPNDVLAAGRKLAGVLAERVRDVVVVGVGLNVSLTEPELPVPEATSLLLAGAPDTDRSALLVVVLSRLAAAVREWDGAAADADVRAAYLARCDTVGREVLVELPSGSLLAGRAVDVDAQGRLVVQGPAGPTAVAAGDVRHVR